MKTQKQNGKIIVFANCAMPSARERELIAVAKHFQGKAAIRLMTAKSSEELSAAKEKLAVVESIFKELRAKGGSGK